MSYRYAENPSGAGSATCVVELDDVAHPKSAVQQPTKALSIKSSSLSIIERLSSSPKNEERGAFDLPPPSTAVSQVKQWNSPRINMWRVFATFYSFIILGMNDAAYGALIPYLETYYNVTYTVISLVFLSPVVGYVTSALVNNQIHMRYGQRGIAILGPLAHLVAYVVISQHPPYPVLVLVFILAGFGQGIADAAWNAWIGDMAHANELMGFLHGFYGLGATLSPLIATAMITRGGAKWYQWYYVMIGAAVLELVFCGAAFWRATGEVFRAEHPPMAEEDTSTNRKKSRTAAAVKNRITWLVSWFLLIYVGIEVALGGWVVTFMMRVRHGSAFASGLTSTGFWAGVTVGRVVLGFVTPRVFKGERWAITTYLLCSAVLELLFWLIPQFYVSAVAVALLGFFLGPLFPAAITAAMKILPRHLHVSAVGFAAAFGSAGACILPFAVGAIAQKKGVQVLQPIVLAMLIVSLAIWVVIGVDLGKQERRDRDVKEGILSRRLHLRRVWGFRGMDAVEGSK